MLIAGLPFCSQNVWPKVSSSFSQSIIFDNLIKEWPGLTILVCRFCGNTKDIRRHGESIGNQKFWCLACRKRFHFDYYYEACRPGVKDKIVDMAMNNSGIRDTDRSSSCPLLILFQNEVCRNKLNIFSPLFDNQHSVTLRARPPIDVSLYFLDISLPVWAIASIALSRSTTWYSSPSVEAIK